MTIFFRSNWRRLAAVFLCAWIALAPALAQARAGGGFSAGSRGGRTYEFNGGQQMQRSVTPPPAAAPQFAPRPGFAPQPSFAQRNPFWSGLAGGFIGAGLVGLLFGHGLWGGGGWGSPFGSLLGLGLQLLLIFWLVSLAMRFFRRRSAFAGDAGSYQPYARTADVLPPPSRAREPMEFAPNDVDLESWTGILVGVQKSWSDGDLAQLRQYVTPEMLSYFSDELSRNASRGVVNRVEDLTLLKGDVTESWREGGFDYATARLHWRARDYGVRLDAPQAIVEGDPRNPVEATELWTFVRSRSGHWLLAAIQQV